MVFLNQDIAYKSFFFPNEKSKNTEHVVCWEQRQLYIWVLADDIWN